MIRLNPTDVTAPTSNAGIRPLAVRDPITVRDPGTVTVRPHSDDGDRPDIAGPVRPDAVHPDPVRPDPTRPNADPDRPDLVRPGADEGGDNIIEGTDGDDVLHGTDRADVIWAHGGNDGVRAGGGDDLVRGGNGNDKLGGGEGDDKIDGGAGNDLLIGGEGSDLLFGGAGNDHVIGGAGADTLVDSVGSDSYSGGEGADTFVFGYTNRASVEHGTGRDHIRDFSREDGDKLQIQGDDLTARFSYGDSDGDGTDDYTIISLIDLSDPARPGAVEAEPVDVADDGVVVGTIMVQDSLLTVSDVEFI